MCLSYQFTCGAVKTEGGNTSGGDREGETEGGETEGGDRGGDRGGGHHNTGLFVIVSVPNCPKH